MAYERPTSELQCDIRTTTDDASLSRTSSRHNCGLTDPLAARPSPARRQSQSETILKTWTGDLSPAAILAVTDPNYTTRDNCRAHIYHASAGILHAEMAKVSNGAFRPKDTMNGPRYGAATDTIRTSKPVIRASKAVETGSLRLELGTTSRVEQLPINGSGKPLRKKPRLDDMPEKGSQSKLPDSAMYDNTNTSSATGSHPAQRGTAEAQKQHMTAMGSSNEFLIVEDMMRPWKSSSRASSLSSSTKTVTSGEMRIKRVEIPESKRPKVEDSNSAVFVSSQEDDLWAKPAASAKKYRGARPSEKRPRSPSVDEISDSAAEQIPKPSAKRPKQEQRELVLSGCDSKSRKDESQSATAIDGVQPQDDEGLRNRFRRMSEDDEKDELANSSPLDGQQSVTTRRRNGVEVTHTFVRDKESHSAPGAAHGTKMSKPAKGKLHPAKKSGEKTYALTACYSRSLNKQASDREPRINATLHTSTTGPFVAVVSGASRCEMDLENINGAYMETNGTRMHIQGNPIKDRAVSYLQLIFVNETVFTAFHQAFVRITGNYHVASRSTTQMDTILERARKGSFKDVDPQSKTVIRQTKSKQGRQQPTQQKLITQMQPAPDDTPKRFQHGQDVDDTIAYETCPVNVAEDDTMATGPSARTRSANFASDDTLEKTSRPQRQPSPQKYSEVHDLGPHWKKPLTYPRKGAGKATVEFDDLWRLDYEALLNDNIISFCLRYAQQKSEQSSRRVHIFNSFFYDSLVKDIPKDRPINYDAVRRWTMKTKIFDNYDYIVVPINQKFHWYAAIICNVSASIVDPFVDLGHEADNRPPTPSKEQDPMRPVQSSEVDVEKVTTTVAGADSETKVPNTPPPAKGANARTLIMPEASHNDHGTLSAATNNETVSPSDTPKSLLVQDTARMSINDVADPDTKSKGSESIVEHVSAAAEAAKSLKSDTSDQKVTQAAESRSNAVKVDKRKKTNTTPTRDPGEPVVLILDSLHGNHQFNAKKLRSYLIAEAKDKISKEITPMRPIHEKTLPGQENFSDCGIYLVGYISKFLEDPEGFVARQARGELSMDPDWQRLQPSVMRNNIRSIIQNEHEVQRAETKSNRDPAAVAASRKHPPYLATAYKEFTEAPVQEVEPSVSAETKVEEQTRIQDAVPRSSQDVDIIHEPGKTELQAPFAAQSPSADTGVPIGVDVPRSSRLADVAKSEDSEDADELIIGQAEPSKQREVRPDVFAQPMFSQLPVMSSKPTPSPEKSYHDTPDLQIAQSENKSSPKKRRSRKPLSELRVIADSQSDAATPSAQFNLVSLLPSSPEPERMQRLVAPKKHTHLEDIADIIDLEDELSKEQKKKKSTKRPRVPSTPEATVQQLPGNTSPPERHKRHRFTKEESPERPVTRGKDQNGKRPGADCAARPIGWILS